MVARGNLGRARLTDRLSLPRRVHGSDYAKSTTSKSSKASGKLRYVATLVNYFTHGFC